MGGRDHKQYGACHRRIILDQAHYFKSTRTQIKSFIRNLNGKFVDLGERDFGECLWIFADNTKGPYVERVPA